LWDGPTPILGICRGAQMMNVARGGTLHQDAFGHYKAGAALRTPLPLRRVTTRASSALAAIMGRERLRVNSLHRQAIDRPGQGLAICAEDQHGMTQAVERVAPGPLRVGVQWHPEFIFWRRSQFRLWARLVREARALKRARLAGRGPDAAKPGRAVDA
ncbi:MAG: gamma-glutamyl-gamma-aminobutyrate hydrolase family protein, partial [Pseudomonadota bacterium]